MLESMIGYLGDHAWAGQMFGVVSATAIVHYLVRHLLLRLAKQLEKTRNLYDDALLEAARRPLAWAIWLVGISWAAESAGGDAVQAEIFNSVGSIREVGIITLLAWFCWRLTRIRTFDARPLYVPNATFASITVENPSRMTNRRIYETIGVRYENVAVLETIIGEVKQMLRDHEAVAQDKTLMVNFNNFGDSSLDFFVYVFTKTTVWTEFHGIKQDVLFRIARIIESNGAEIAFPTRTVMLEQAGS